MDHLIRRTNFVPDRELFNAVRAANSVCLSPAEVSSLLDAVNRDKMLAALAGYGAPDSPATAFVDRYLGPILLRRKKAAQARSGRDRPEAQAPSVPRVSERPGCAGTTSECVSGPSGLLVVEVSTDSTGCPTLAITASASGSTSPRDKARVDQMSFQLARDELAAYAHVLLGLKRVETISRCNGEALVLDWRGASIETRAMRSGTVLCHVMLEPSRVFYMAMLATHRIAAGCGLSQGIVLAHLRATAGHALRPGEQASPGTVRR